MKRTLMYLSIGIVAVLLTMVFVRKTIAWDANFNFGADTYELVDNLLIVNSLGDNTEESQFEYNGKNLGYNDYIPENAFKNNLYNEGYSKVYDSNNLNLDLTEVGYMGRLGDPRAYDKDYVLTSEYEKYSSQNQDVRIENNKGNIINNSNKITNNTSNINNVEIESKDRDNTLQNNINNETNTRYNEDIKLDDKIIDVDDRHTIINNRQDNTLANHDNRITSNSNKIERHEERIGDLEDTKYSVRGELQFIRKKNLTVGIYGKTDVRHPNINNEVGLNIVIGLGKSWEEEEFEKMEGKMRKLETMIEKGLKWKAGKDISIKKETLSNGNVKFSIDREGTAKMMEKF